MSATAYVALTLLIAAFGAYAFLQAWRDHNRHNRQSARSRAHARATAWRAKMQACQLSRVIARWAGRGHHTPKGRIEHGE